MRRMTAEVRLDPADLILPLFVADDLGESGKPRIIASMPGVYQHSMDSLVEICREAVSLGIPCVDLFGVPRSEDKDASGSQAWDPDGVLNRAIARLRDEFGVYGTDTGRMCVAALNEKNIGYVCESIAKVM